MGPVRNGRSRLLYICDWLPPDFGAVGQYSVMFARELATRGSDVTLAGLSTFGNCDDTETLGQGRYREAENLNRKALAFLRFRAAHATMLCNPN
ncbi:MAG: hypothetical protein ACRD36_04760 [Candidatus Acidiferrum sp.]